MKNEDPTQQIVRQWLASADWGPALESVRAWIASGGHVDGLWEAVQETADPSRWMFLLYCLSDDVPFSEERREQILSSVAPWMMEQHPRQWDWWETGRVFDRVLSSDVHGSSASRWLEDQIKSAAGESLVGAAALRMGVGWEEATKALGARKDASEIAPSFLRFWPGTRLGLWAAELADAPACLEWLQKEAPESLLMPRGFAASRGRASDGLCAALSVVIATRALASSLPDEERIGLYPRSGTVAQGYERYFTRYFAREILEALVPRLGEEMAVSASRVFARTFVKDPSEWVIASEEGKTLNLDGTIEALMDDLEPSLRAAIVSRAERCFGRSGDTELRIEPDEDLDILIEADLEEDVLVALLGSLLADLMHVSTEKPVDRLHSIQSRWTYQLWPSMEGRMRTASPGQTALFLAMGWSQSLTTRRWPVGKKWEAVTGWERPRDALAASQWCLMESVRRGGDMELMEEAQEVLSVSQSSVEERPLASFLAKAISLHIRSVA